MLATTRSQLPVLYVSLTITNYLIFIKDTACIVLLLPNIYILNLDGFFIYTCINIAIPLNGTKITVEA